MYSTVRSPFDSRPLRRTTIAQSPVVINFTLQATHDIQTQRRWCGGGRTDGGDLFIELMRCDDECARLDQVTGPLSFFGSLTYTCCAVIITLSGGGGAAR